VIDKVRASITNRLLDLHFVDSLVRLSRIDLPEFVSSSISRIRIPDKGQEFLGNLAITVDRKHFDEKQVNFKRRFSRE